MGRKNANVRHANRKRLKHGPKGDVNRRRFEHFPISNRTGEPIAPVWKKARGTARKRAA